MKILEITPVSVVGNATVRFIRIDPEDVSVTLSEILKAIMDLSWLKNFDDDFIADFFIAYVSNAGCHIFCSFHQHIIYIQRCIDIDCLIYILLAAFTTDDIFHTNPAAVSQRTFYISDDVHFG